jgi:uncharacterized protein (DUF1778 family)
MATRSEKLDLRVAPTDKQKIAAAAAIENRSVSEFILHSALLRADAILIDRTHFGLNAERWEAFMAALDAPPRRFDRLERLFKESSVFEKNTQA